MEEKEVVNVEEPKEEKAEVVEAKPEGNIVFSILAFAFAVTGFGLLFTGWGAIASIVLGILALIFYKKGAEHRQPFRVFKKLGRIFGKIDLILGIVVTVLLIALLITLIVLAATGAIGEGNMPDWLAKLAKWVGYQG